MRYVSILPIVGLTRHHHVYLGGSRGVNACKELEGYAFDDHLTYDCVLLTRQKKAVGPLLEKLGFKLVLASTNPNTHNRLHLYVRTATK
jgi:hypothetical protein